MVEIIFLQRVLMILISSILYDKIVIWLSLNNGVEQYGLVLALAVVVIVVVFVVVVVAKAAFDVVATIRNPAAMIVATIESNFAVLTLGKCMCITSWLLTARILSNMHYPRNILIHT
jgi:hypothetical protein